MTAVICGLSFLVVGSIIVGLGNDDRDRAAPTSDKHPLILPISPVTTDDKIVSMPNQEEGTRASLGRADQATLDRLVSYTKEACLVGTQIDLHADVNGNITIRNPLKPGAEGTFNAKKTDASGAIAYINEQVRLNADRQIQDCILPYMIRIFEAVLGTNIQPSPGAPSAKLLQAPESAKMADTVSWDGFSIGLYSCSNQKESPKKQIISCFFVLTKNDNGERDYSDEEMTRWQPKLIDNFRIEHNLVQLYLLNGRGHRQSKINLEKGDHIWFAAEFADGSDDISSARIVFMELRASSAPRACEVTREMNWHVCIPSAEASTIFGYTRNLLRLVRRA